VIDWRGVANNTETGSECVTTQLYWKNTADRKKTNDTTVTGVLKSVTPF
jgi:hypothetical protein